MTRWHHSCSYYSRNQSFRVNSQVGMDAVDRMNILDINVRHLSHIQGQMSTRTIERTAQYRIWLRCMQIYFNER